MEIIFAEDKMPSEICIEKMIEAAQCCLDMEKIDKNWAEVSVSFVSKEEIRELNKRYRSVDKVTDVLSFPQFDDLNELPSEEPICLGDVVICEEQADLQAQEFGHSKEREVIYLFVHSMFHLLGYDHMREEEKAEMRIQEEAVMTAIALER